MSTVRFTRKNNLFSPFILVDTSELSSNIELVSSLEPDSYGYVTCCEAYRTFVDEPDCYKPLRSMFFQKTASGCMDKHPDGLHP